MRVQPLLCLSAESPWRRPDYWLPFFLSFFFRFLEFSLESSSPKRSAKYLRKQPRTTRNGSFRFTTRILVKRRVLGKRANLGILTLSPPLRWTDRFYPDCKLLRGEVIQHRGRPTCSTRYPKNARLDIKFASRMIRDRYDFTEEEKRSLHRFSMHLLSLSLSPFSSSFLSIQSFHPSPFNLILSSRALRKGSN